MELKIWSFPKYNRPIQKNNIKRQNIFTITSTPNKIWKKKKEKKCEIVKRNVFGNIFQKKNTYLVEKDVEITCLGCEESYPDHPSED